MYKGQTSDRETELHWVSNRVKWPVKKSMWGTGLGALS